jgi:predicted nuclease of predicted toxin-antitoxin system
MKLLLDQGLPRSTAVILRSAGIDTVHTAEIGLATEADAKILEQGLTEGRVIVTLDADFHLLMATSNATHPSVIRIRIERLRGAEVANILQYLLNQYSEDLRKGVLMTVQKGRVRFRRLPITT